MNVSFSKLKLLEQLKVVPILKQLEIKPSTLVGSNKYTYLFDSESKFFQKNSSMFLKNELSIKIVDISSSYIKLYFLSKKDSFFVTILDNNYSKLNNIKKVTTNVVSYKETWYPRSKDLLKTIKKQHSLKKFVAAKPRLYNINYPVFKDTRPHHKKTKFKKVPPYLIPLEEKSITLKKTSNFRRGFNKSTPTVYPAFVGGSIISFKERRKRSFWNQKRYFKRSVKRLNDRIRARMVKTVLFKNEDNSELVTLFEQNIYNYMSLLLDRTKKLVHKSTSLRYFVTSTSMKTLLKEWSYKLAQSDEIVNSIFKYSLESNSFSPMNVWLEKLAPSNINTFFNSSLVLPVKVTIAFVFSEYFKKNNKSYLNLKSNILATKIYYKRYIYSLFIEEVLQLDKTVSLAIVDSYLDNLVTFYIKKSVSLNKKSTQLPILFKTNISSKYTKRKSNFMKTLSKAFNRVITSRKVSLKKETIVFNRKKNSFSMSLNNHRGETIIFISSGMTTEKPIKSSRK